jgi:hypothetical protein
MSIEIESVRYRIQKVAASGAVMDLQEQIAFFGDVDKLLKVHAKQKHPTLSAEGAFVKEMESDEQFRSVLQKSRELQQELNYSN